MVTNFLRDEQQHAKRPPNGMTSRIQKTTKQAHLIDISGVFFRYYFAPSRSRVNDEGWDVAALFGTVSWLLRQNELFEAAFVVVAFDESLGTGFRHTLDEEYKANRALPTEDIIYQFECLKFICENLGFSIFSSSEYEADDIIATAVNSLSPIQCTIHSRDKDLRQLLCPTVIQRDFMTQKEWTHESLLAEDGVTPTQVPLLLALMGDASDNIVGVPRVGAKTAVALLKQFGTWAAILDAVELGVALPVRGEKAIRELLLEFSELIPHNLLLTELALNAEIGDIQPRGGIDSDVLQAFFPIIGLSGLTSALDSRK